MAQSRDQSERPTLSLYALAGIASPLLLAAATILVASRRPEYSHFRDAISELGGVGRPGAALMNYFGIIPAGLLTAISARMTQQSFGPGRLALSAAVAQAIGGLCLAATALVAWIGAATGLSSSNNKLHLAFALTGFLGLALAPLLLGLHIRRKQGVRGWFIASIVSSIAIFLFGFILPRPPYLGIFQRAALATFFLWLIALSVSELRRRRPQG